MLFQFVVRNFKKRPFLNFIKVLGLALGLSGILFHYPFSEKRTYLRCFSFEGRPYLPFHGDQSDVFWQQSFCPGL